MASHESLSPGYRSEEIQEVFLTYDKDGDGYLDRVELGTMMISLCDGIGISVEEVDFLIASHDTQNLGKLSFEDFCSFMQSETLSYVVNTLRERSSSPLFPSEEGSAYGLSQQAEPGTGTRMYDYLMQLSENNNINNLEINRERKPESEFENINNAEDGEQKRKHEIEEENLQDKLIAERHQNIVEEEKKQNSSSQQQNSHKKSSSPTSRKKIGRIPGIESLHKNRPEDKSNILNKLNSHPDVLNEAEEEEDFEEIWKRKVLNNETGEDLKEESTTINTNKTIAPISIKNEATIHPSEWTVQEISNWLTDLGPAYVQYVKEFLDNGVDGKLLLELTENDLNLLGVKNELHVKKLLTEIDALFHSLGISPKQTIPPEGQQLQLEKTFSACSIEDLKESDAIVETFQNSLVRQIQDLRKDINDHENKPFGNQV